MTHENVQAAEIATIFAEHEAEIDYLIRPMTRAEMFVLMAVIAFFLTVWGAAFYLARPHIVEFVHSIRRLAETE